MILFTIMPFSAFAFYIVTNNRTAIIQEYTSLTQERLNTCASLINQELDQYALKSRYIASNKDITGGLLRGYGNDLEGKVVFVSIVIRYIQYLELLDNPGKKIFTLYISNQSLYANNYIRFLTDLAGDSFVQNVVDRAAIMEEIWSPTSNVNEKGELEIIFYKKVLPYVPDKTILQVRIPFSQVIDLIHSVDFPKGTLVMYRDAQGKIAYVESQPGKTPEGIPSQLEDSYILLEKPLLNGHRLIAAIPKQEINSIVMVSVRNTLFVFLLILFSVIVASTWTAKGITSDLNQFIDILKNRRDADIHLEESLAAGAEDELAWIKRRFKDLLNKNEALSQQALQASQHGHQLEVELLQSKLNPHLLYNSLSVIKWTALRNRDEKTVKMVDSMTRYYRAVLNRGNDILQVRDELNMVAEYVRVNEYAHSAEYHLTTEASGDIQDECIIKHLLQPVVENAILHGLIGKEGDKCIVIRCARQDENLRFEVEDNGYGIDQETIARILRLDIKKEHGGYGLRNLISRIRICYGEAARITIQSEKGRYTRVTILVPTIKKG